MAEIEKTKQIKYDTVWLDSDSDALAIIDQTLLPNETVILRLTTAEDIFEAIYKLRVRGAPAIGVAAAIGIYAVMVRFETDDPTTFRSEFERVHAYLVSARPTAVNLSWALRRMSRLLCDSSGSVSALKAALRAEALKIWAEDIEICRAIGENALSLLNDGDGILTHCNAGQLATVRYGTALAPIHVGRERGMRFHVFTDETRPLLQGARLSAYELCADGVETTLICDNMASSVMRRGWVSAVIVGADRIAANGDTANKIGTSGVAILAKHYGIPFYVCAPLSTIDISCPHGDEIRIEQRAADEVTDMWYSKRMAPEGVGVYNPAFDVTDNSLISAIITEKGILRAPFDAGIRALFGGYR